MTIATELTTLNDTKLAIKAAIESKGQSLIGVDFAGYAPKISSIIPGIPDQDDWTQAWYDNAAKVLAWVRPADWLQFPTDPVEGDQICYALKEVFDTDGEYIALTANGNFTVDWGDGSIVNYATGVTAEHKYNYTTLSDTARSNGSKQVIITITPQVSSSLTFVNFNIRHSAVSVVYETGLLDIIFASAPSATTPIFGATNSGVKKISCYSVERVKWLCQSFTGTNISYLFLQFASIESITFPALPNVTNASFLCNSCRKLAVFPEIYAPLLSVITAAFQNTFNLIAFPLLNSSLTTVGTAFAGTYKLKLIPPLDLLSTTNATNVLFGNIATKPPLFNLSNLTVAQGFFQNNYCIMELPAFDFSKVTNAFNLFYGCLSLKEIYNLNLGLATDITSLFYNNTALVNIIGLNLSSATTTTTAFFGCASVKRLVITGLKSTISIANMSLAARELDEVFTNLTTVTGQSITITGNPGAATCTTSIATAKGWTVIN